MRLQHRKLLTPVNAQFLNNAEKLAAKSRGGEGEKKEKRKKERKACSPNNGILKVQSFVRDVISMIHCNIFHICTSHTCADQKAQTRLRQTLDGRFVTNTILRCDRRCIHLSTYSSPTQPVLFNSDRSCFDKKMCAAAAVKRRGSPGKSTFFSLPCIYNCEARASSRSEQDEEIR